MWATKCLIYRDFLALLFASKSVLKMGLFGQMALKMGHRAAKKGRRPAFFAPMYPPHHPRGVGGGLGPAR